MPSINLLLCGGKAWVDDQFSRLSILILVGPKIGEHFTIYINK